MILLMVNCINGSIVSIICGSTVYYETQNTVRFNTPPIWPWISPFFIAVTVTKSTFACACIQIHNGGYNCHFAPLLWLGGMSVDSKDKEIYG